MVFEQPTGRTHISSGVSVLRSPSLWWSTIPKMVASAMSLGL